MKKNEEYWVKLYNDGKILIDFDTGLVYAKWDSVTHVIGGKKFEYSCSTRGPSKNETYHILLHRLIWIIARGDIPKGFYVCHRNDNKRDNRLDNLELRTLSQSAIHSHRVLGKKSGVTRGEKNPSAKLTWKEVDEIRQRHHNEGISAVELSKSYCVGKSTIWNIVNNKYWKKE